jgi:hypothetical protein
LLEHLGGGCEQDVVAGAAGAMAEGLSDVRLAGAGAANEQDVFVALDEGAGRQFDDARLGDLGVEMEIEVLERLVALERGAADALIEVLGVAALDFVREEPHEELLMGDLIVDGLSDA